ncbi:actin interacting protein 3-domain-containing protein [Phakopsora pachyrhizi]|uniref:Actin interacting protein 3-domain-containing protein n=1 Tax=Phakopsora pachyrhizi TaxID=170000 RepID=A0AAV0AFJ4_PHAPC|nr:actin interacting protein 3-domain-containing protein [Phakopsora pachyrhizi]CAH7666893.1 actin interacting protein 3-domain-containing protein [Phakopsora pachyrhizi]
MQHILIYDDQIWIQTSVNPLASSHMESTVTRLLVATKQLLESLTDWSHGRIDEGAVSDIYVRLGNEFNSASLAFSREGIDMSDLNSVPDDLRVCLEAALSEDATPATLDQHLPQIRQIVVHLLQGLKAKQAKWRAAKRQQEMESSQSSSNSTAIRPGSSRDFSSGSYPNPNSRTSSRTLSSVRSREDLRRVVVSSSSGDHYRGQGPRAVVSPPLGQPTQPPTIPEHIKSSPPNPGMITGLPASPRSDQTSLSQASSLEALRKTDMLQRRASKRFSTYTYNKIASSASPHKRNEGQSGIGLGIILSPSPQLLRANSAKSGSALSQNEHPTIFLQLGRDVKKAKLDSSPTIASLRVLFMDRFQYSPGSDDFPTIYLRDPKSGIQYQLEDMNDVKDRIVLSLNIDALDQVKTHIDSGMSSLTREIKELKSTIVALRRQSIPPPSISFTNAARQVLQRVNSEVQSQSAIETVPSTVLPNAKPGNANSSVQHDPAVSPSDIKLQQFSGIFKDQFNQVQSLRRELGVLRQLYGTFTGDTKDMLVKLRTQSEQVKQIAASKVSSTRTFIDSGKAKVESKSQDLVTKIESLQDTVEDLKQDVTSRKIRPKPNAMSSVSQSISAVEAELEEFTNFLSTVKPSWKKSWEDELQNIVDEQQLLNYQEDLAKDLKEDLEAVASLFGHVKDYIDARKTSKAKVKEFIPPVGFGSSTSGLRGGLDTVMMEVKSIEPDATVRLKAIEAAEKLREKKIKEVGMDDEFATELAGFVGERKLKMTGGTEEVERIRSLKSEQALKAMATANLANDSKETGPGKESSPTNSQSPEGNQADGDEESKENEEQEPAAVVEAEQS